MWLQDRLTGLAPRQRLSLVGEGGLAAEHLGHKGWNVTAGLSAPHPSSGDPVCSLSLLRRPVCRCSCLRASLATQLVLWLPCGPCPAVGPQLILSGVWTHTRTWGGIPLASGPHGPGWERQRPARGEDRLAPGSDGGGPGGRGHTQHHVWVRRPSTPGGACVGIWGRASTQGLPARVTRWWWGRGAGGAEAGVRVGRGVEATRGPNT